MTGQLCFLPQVQILTNTVQVNGKLGSYVIRHLQALSYAVTVYTTDTITAAETYPGIQTILADYSNLPEQIPLFRGFDALVILFSRAQDLIQTTFVDAAIEAGIPHIIPSMFILDTRNPLVQENPIYTPKIEVENHLHLRAAEGLVSFTTIQTGVFLEWGMQIGVPINLTGTTPTLLFDGGDTQFSTSSLDDIGRAVATALNLRHDDRVRNQTLRMHSTITTQNELLQLARELKPELEWNIIHVDTESAYISSFEAWERGERDPAALRGLMPRMTYGLGLCLFEQNDNDLLGVQVWDRERLKRAVEEAMARAQGG